MPFERVRFVHAAGCLLDRPLPVRDEWPDPVRRTVRDAPLAAFRRLVTLCVDEDVDFLLLVGDVFDDVRRTLSARLELREACDLLGEAGIRLFVVPGPCDPAPAWREAGVLDDHVALLAGDGATPCDVVRDGRSVVRFVEPHRSATRFDAPAPRADELRPLTIAARRAACDLASLPECSADYGALGGGTRRTLETERGGLLHDPGPLQGRGMQEAGPHGATLATVGADGRLHLEFRSLAPVVWTARNTTVAPDLSPAELVPFLQHEQDRQAADLPGAAVEIATWMLHGRGAHLAQLLRDESECRRAEAELRDLGTSDGVPARVHRLVCRPFDPHSTPSSGDAPDAWSSPRRAPLAARFLEHLSDVVRDGLPLGEGVAGHLGRGPRMRVDVPAVAPPASSTRSVAAQVSDAAHAAEESSEDERLAAALARAAREVGFDMDDLDEDRVPETDDLRIDEPVHAPLATGPRHRLDLPHADEEFDRCAGGGLLLGPVGRCAADVVVPEEPTTTGDRRRLAAALAEIAVGCGTGESIDRDAVREAARAWGLTWFDHEASAASDPT